MTRLAIDMSSYLKTALKAGVDAKDGIHIVFEDKPVIVNSAEYGYENFTNMMLRTLHETRLKPKDCLLVFEGMSSKSKRLLIDATYKGKRDKKPPEFYEQFQRLREFIESQWLGLGAISMCQDYAEADDTLTFLAKESEEDIIIATRDGDLTALNTEANAYGARVETWIDGMRGLELIKLDGELFPHPPKYVTLYKALVGDSSDSVPGCKGFGASAFQKLAEQYGYDGLDQLIDMLDSGNLGGLHALAEQKEHKLFKKLVEQEAQVVRCWKLVKMYPEWVNTMKYPLKIQGGKLTPAPTDLDERLKDFYSQEWLVTNENYVGSYEFLANHLDETHEPTFDIETSTPDESDEWLASRPKGKGLDKVDQLGSILTGFSITFGANNEYTMYVSVDHADTDNVPMSRARAVLELLIHSGKKIVIQNNFFELSVLAMQKDEDGTPWIELWKDLGARGFMPNTLDTKYEASYVNENVSNGLKFRSKFHLGYEQTSYAATTQLEGWEKTLPAGGRVLHREQREGNMGDWWVTRAYKMRELTGEHVTAYGCDDTICTAALHNLFKLIMQIEHTYNVYLETEIDASYQHAKNFIDGIPFSLEKMRELEQIDDVTWDRSWAVLRDFLMKNGWDGTVPPVYTEVTPAAIKEAFKIVMGYTKGGVEIEAGFGLEEDEDIAEASGAEGEEAESSDAFLSSRVRTPAKLVALLKDQGHEVFAGMVEQWIAGDHVKFTAWVCEHFTGEPIFKIGTKQMCKLLYEVMALPVRVRNKPTEIMRSKGIKEGNAKADNLALEYALREASDEHKQVIEAIKLMTMVKTRRSLYYVNYPHFVHWKTGRIHPSHNQCQTNTRRASESDPNKTQLPKHAKITGQPARFRETIVPHKPSAVIVSMDFVAQELRVIADYSRDENMVACYVGDNKKDMHALTGASVLQWREKQVDWSYPAFVEILDNDAHLMYKKVKEHRNLGKKINFTTEFGAMAPKLAMTMLVTEAEAQIFIDAKEKNFPGVRVWKDETIAESKRLGFVTTMSGARRHLRDVYMGDDHWLKSKAERQSVNFKVQGSSAEMTKRAEGRMWQEGIFFDFDAVCLGPIHDEIVASVVVDDRFLEFLKRMHWCMVQPYGNMWIPIESSISFGKNFGDQIEVGDQPIAAAVSEGLKKLYDQASKAS